MSLPARRLLQRLQNAGLEHKVAPPKDLRSKPMNGVGALTIPCQKITLRYHPRTIHTGRRSEGLVSFILNDLRRIASTHPHIEFCVQQYNEDKPVITGQYVRTESYEYADPAYTRSVDVERLDRRHIKKKVEQLILGDGRERKLNVKVIPAGREGVVIRNRSNTRRITKMGRQFFTKTFVAWRSDVEWDPFHSPVQYRP
ncbi:hypothetical protein HK097_008113 [Rhizophlyctis rosea]|uniref:Uncharacterized protein n=1 Tax=Rhizophlyctis rosea TaxID=64517 RepID=A0AAD5SCR7_9FUNG|nr:hypothetical protein HK097_008113 [Rhizophlyctis rosea]